MDKILAEKVIEKLASYTTFTNMELIGLDGIVIAGRLMDRIGYEDQNARNVFRTNMDIMPKEHTKGEAEAYLSVPDVGKRQAVLRITGDGGMILDMVQGVKLALQLILEYESAAREPAGGRTDRDHFLSLLFHEPFHREEVYRYSEALQIAEDRLRIPVLIEMDAGRETIRELQQYLTDGERFTDQDLMEVTKEGWIILFKTVDCPAKQFMQEYKYVMAQFLSEFLHQMRGRNIRYSLYFGPAQNDFSSYRQAVYDCEWMQRNIRKTGSFYFYDYVVKFLESEAPLRELDTIYGVLGKQMGEKVIGNYMETMEVLIDKDYNLIKASECLHIHKNTLVYRLDKIRERLNMNPLIYHGDREFMEGFYYYLKRIREG